MDFRDLHKVGDGLSSFDIARMITDTWLYTLSKEDLKKVVQQAENLLRYIQEREDTEKATSPDRWWYPDRAYDVLPYPAQCFMMGVACAENPDGKQGAIYAVKYLRKVWNTGDDFFAERSLSELKQLCDAYKWEVVTGQVPFPYPAPYGQQSSEK